MLLHILLVLILNSNICSSSIFRQINSPFTIKQLINFDQLNKIVETALGIEQNSLFSSPSNNNVQLQNQPIINRKLELTKPSQIVSTPSQSTVPKIRPLNSIQKSQLTSLLSDNWTQLKNSTPLNFFNYDIDLTKPLPFTYFSPTPSVEPDLKMDVPEMIRYRGFKAETHQVITKDCYILQLHRIVHPKLINIQKKAILLQHGLMGTSADFLMNSLGGSLDDKDNRNLGFYLAKLGYDVWLSNSRGNVYSTNHTTLNPNKHKLFWQFTFDEMASFDLPATIAYIQNYTKLDTIGYVGHSQGTLILFQLLAIRPEFEKIVKPIILLAPVARVNNVRTPIKFLSYQPQLMKNFLKNYDSYLNLKSLRPNFLSDILCRNQFEFFCKNMLFLLGGFDTRQLNSTRLQVYSNNFPAGTSTWNIAHYGQMVRDRRAQWFNYESKEDNFKCYGQEQPPEIDLTKIRSPYLNLIYSENDWLADLEDVQFLRASLKVKFNEHKIPFKDWNHFDFLIGKDTDIYVNNVLVNMLLKYENDYEINSSKSESTNKQQINEAPVKLTMYDSHDKYDKKASSLSTSSKGMRTLNQPTNEEMSFEDDEYFTDYVPSETVQILN